MSDRTTHLLYWLLSLGIALAMWYVSAVEKREPESEKTLEASVSYNNKPENLVILNRVPEVSVRLRGRSRDIRRLRPREVDVEVDLSDISATDAGSFSFNLDDTNVFLPYDGLELVAIDPKFITLQLEAKQQKRVPIQLRLVGEPAAGATVEGTEVNPNTALVEGPQSRIEPLQRVRTSPVNLDGHALTFQEEVPVVADDPMLRIIQPPTVTARIIMQLPSTSNGGAARRRGFR